MSDIRLTVSRNIKKYRIQRHQSQEELAYKSKISAAHLSKIERGDHNITITTLARVAEALQVDLNVLLDGSNQEQFLTATTLSFIQRYVSEIDKLPPEQLKIIQTVLDSLISLVHQD